MNAYMNIGICEVKNNNIVNECECGVWEDAYAINSAIMERVNKYDNLADGVYTISIDSLIDLKEVCTDVKNDNSLAPEILPFANGTIATRAIYGIDYFMQVDKTIEIIDEILDQYSNIKDSENHRVFVTEY